MKSILPGGRGVAAVGTDATTPDLEKIPFYETRLVFAHLLHQVLRLGHGAFGELPFMQAVEVIVIVTAIFLAENNGEPFSTSGLSKHLAMPRATMFRRLAFLEQKEIICRDAHGLRINPRIFATPTRDEAVRRLRQIIIDTGATLSKSDVQPSDAPTQSD
jgi:hypothetical protein